LTSKSTSLESKELVLQSTFMKKYPSKVTKVIMNRLLTFECSVLPTTLFTWPVNDSHHVVWIY